MYAPRFVLPYHCWPGRKYFPELVFTQTLAAVDVEDSVDVAASLRESGDADPFTSTLA
jgi:hypothetical protein